MGAVSSAGVVCVFVTELIACTEVAAPPPELSTAELLGAAGLGFLNCLLPWLLFLNCLVMVNYGVLFLLLVFLNGLRLVLLPLILIHRLNHLLLVNFELLFCLSLMLWAWGFCSSVM